MSDVTITTVEGTVTSPTQSVGTAVTVYDGGEFAPRFILLAHGVSTPPAGTPVGSLIFQKGA